MKITITMKNPDCGSDAIDEAVETYFDSREDKDIGREEFRKIVEHDISKFVEWSEYITVEIDTETDTAKVIPVGE